MNVTVTNQTKNDLLSRDEIEATINFDGPTPSRAKVLKALTESVKAKPETLIIKQILNEYGKSFAKVIAYSYKDKETMEKLERKNLIEKHAKKKDSTQNADSQSADKEEAAPAAEAPKEEAPVEEKAPEAKEEKKEEADKKEAAE